MLKNRLCGNDLSRTFFGVRFCRTLFCFERETAMKDKNTMTEEALKDLQERFQEAIRQKQLSDISKISVETQNEYKEAVMAIWKSICYKNAAELLSCGFIDPYEISVFTQLKLEEVLAIKIKMEHLKLLGHMTENAVPHSDDEKVHFPRLRRGK